MIRKRKKSVKRGERLCLVRERPRKSEAIFRIVRQLALKERKAGSQRFLSLREAARHFKVPLSTMAAVYRRLTEEGILSGVRASRTMLQGREASRSLKVRGLVGLPLSVPSLHTLRGYRDCFLRLSEELHRRGFAISPLHFEEAEIAPDVVARRAREEKLDTVVWLRLHGARHDTAARLRDVGIQFVGVNIGGVVGGFCQYEVRRRRAIAIILHDWRTASKLKTAILVRAGREALGEKERMARLGTLASLEEMDFQVASVPEGRITRFLKSLRAEQKNGVLLADSAASILGSRAHDTLAEVFSSCRIGLIDGPAEFPFAGGTPNAVADVVAVDWGRIGRRIAQDLLSGEALTRSETIVFEAEAHLRAQLSDYNPERPQDGFGTEARGFRPG
jgi:hypothetical protein